MDIQALREMEQEVAPIIENAKILINGLSPRHLWAIEELLNAVYIHDEHLDRVDLLEFEASRESDGRICVGDGVESLYDLMAEVIRVMGETRDVALIPFHEALSRKADELEETLKALFEGIHCGWSDFQEYLRHNCVVRGEVALELKAKEVQLLPYADLADALSTEELFVTLDNFDAHDEQQTSMQAAFEMVKFDRNLIGLSFLEQASDECVETQEKIKNTLENYKEYSSLVDDEVPWDFEGHEGIREALEFRKSEIQHAA